MSKIIVSDEQYDSLVDIIENPPEPSEALIEAMSRCSMCSSKAEVGTVEVKYVIELDEMCVVRELLCEKCNHKLKRGLKT